MCASLRSCRWDRGERKASVWRKLRNQHRSARVQKRNWSLFWYTHNGHSHTLQRALLKRHHDRRTQRTERNAGNKNHSRLLPSVEKSFRCSGEGKGLGGGDEHFSPNWHGVLRGRRREGAMLAQRCVGLAFDYDGELSPKLTHKHGQRLLLNKGRDGGGGKRTNVQGRPMDGAEFTKRSGPPFRDTGATSTRPSKDEAEPPDPTADDAGCTFCRNERNESGRFMERLCRRFVHQ